jgi:hypothetical protein
LLRLIAVIAGAAILIAPQLVAASEPTAPDLAACRTAADRPICLLKLAARSHFHQSYRENIKIGYAPGVLAAIGPDPADDPSSHGVLHLTWAAPAVQALILDRSGADPEAALAPIRAMTLRTARDRAGQARLEADTAAFRIYAYEMLWKAGHGEEALPPSSRPSAALSRAVLEAWRRDLPKAGEDGRPEELADIYRGLGEARTADAIAPERPVDRVNRLIEAGRYDEAGALLDQLQSEPAGALTSKGRLEAAMTQYLYATTRGEIVRKAAAAGRMDLALRLSESELRRWLDGASSQFMTIGADAAGLQVAQDLVLVAEQAPRSVALDYVRRMDMAGRDKSVRAAPISALAAMRGWTALGEPARVEALMSFWSKDVEEAGKSCDPRDLKLCMQRPAVLIPMGLKSQPLGTPWNELAPGSDASEARMLAAGPSGIDARLTKLRTPRERIELLFRCAREAAIQGALPLAAHCARRLAVEPEDAAPRPLGVETALTVAASAARHNDQALRQEMLALAFDLAPREPAAELDPHDLEAIAVAELRAQGRL